MDTAILDAECGRESPDNPKALEPRMINFSNNASDLDCHDLSISQQDAPNISLE